jgi:hypothetical protein
MGKNIALVTEPELKPYTLDTLRMSFESAVRNSLDLFSLCQTRYPKVWLAELPRIYIPICVEFSLHARRVNEISKIDQSQIGEIVSHRLSYLEDKEGYSVDRNYPSALNRIIHSKYISLAHALARDVETGNELNQLIIGIEAESDRRERSLIDLAGLVLLFRNEVVPKVQSKWQKLVQSSEEQAS